MCPNRVQPPTIQNSLMRAGNFFADKSSRNAAGSLCVKQWKTPSKKTHPGDRECEGLNSGGVAREVDEEGGTGCHLLLHGEVERPHGVWVHRKLGRGEHTSTSHQQVAQTSNRSTGSHVEDNVLTDCWVPCGA